MNATINNIKQNRVPRSGERHARIDTIGSSPGRVLVALTLAACLWTPMNSRARAQTFVTSSGSFAPVADDVDNPFLLVEAAIAADRSDSRIAIRPGIYKEAFIADKPCVLEPSDAGVVTIGDLSAVATTTLKIATLNTHLFGDEVFGGFFGGTWEDDQRAIDIGEICAASDWDVVAFQEIWDEHLFYGGDGQEGIRPIAGFDWGQHGDRTDCIICANSGLAIMSRVGMNYFGQRFFSDCPGDPAEQPDRLASKGWVEAEIIKDGFPIFVLNTHTQAGNDSDEQGARFIQISCLLSRALVLRDLDSELTIVIVGDLNLPGETGEYMSYVDLFSGDSTFFEDVFGRLFGDFLLAIFGGRYEEIAGFWDGARNVPGFDEAEHYTNSPDNELSLCFDQNTSNARLDYIIVIPPRDDSITVIPESVNVFPFLGRELRDTCKLDAVGGVIYELDSKEKSDHWAVEAELKFFRN